MTIFQQILLFLILYICVYALIDRVCKCIEHCSTDRAFSKFKENGVMVRLDTIKKQIKEFNEVNKHGKSGKTEDRASEQD